jgi:aspartyl protease family protein
VWDQGTLMLRFAFGTLALAALVGLLSREGAAVPEAPAAAINQKTHSKAAEAPHVTGEVALQREADGHFYAQASVNGTPVRFLVDTGASTIALTRADAERVGLLFTDSEFTGSAQTASGSVGVKPLTLDKVELGNLNPGPVDAAIVDKGLGISLLGQSWLKKMNSVTIEGDKMVLR